MDRLRREARSELAQLEREKEKSKSELAELERQKQRARLELLQVKDDAHRTKMWTIQEKSKLDQELKRKKRESELQRDRDFMRRATMRIDTPAGGKFYMTNDADPHTLKDLWCYNPKSFPPLTD